MNTQEVTHSLISDFFNLDMRQNNRLQSSSQIRAAWEEKQHLSCSWTALATPATSRCAVLWRAEPDTSHYCPAFEMALTVISHQIKFPDNLQLPFHCKFRQAWLKSPSPIIPFLSTGGWTNTPSLSLTLCWCLWTLTLLGLSLWGSNTLSHRRRPVSCLSCCR